MSELRHLFCKRLGISKDKEFTFDTLDYLLQKTAESFPFENLCIISNQTRPITKENLIYKILIRKEGGLCYELNPILYFFLLEYGFDVKLIRGDVFNHSTNSWSNLEGTHVAILLHYKGLSYLVDTGFGGNLPLKPVPLDGQIISSRNGDFRVKAVKSEFGDYLFEMKLSDRDEDWRIGYAFDTSHPIENTVELSNIQKIIMEDERSSFNKAPLITQLTRNGHITLTSSSFTQWKDGQYIKEQIDQGKFKELAKEHFGFIK